MKTMTCRQLGGACDHTFSADSFEEIAQISKEHGMAMFEKNDQAHLDAMKKMRAMMSEPDAFEKWYATKEKEFEQLPEA